MIKKKISIDRVLLYAVCVITLCLTVAFVRKNNGANDTVFVDIGKLVDNYKLKKDLEVVSSKNLYSIKNAIDSLKMVKKLAGTNTSHLDSMIENAGYAFNKYYQQSNQEISKKVWERLNPAIEQYGKEKGLEIIIGANGAGTVLYGSKKRDITEDLIKYLNTKYEKGS